MRLKDLVLIGRVAGIGLAFIIGFHHGWEGIIWFAPLIYLVVCGAMATASLRWEEDIRKLSGK